MVHDLINKDPSLNHLNNEQRLRQAIVTGLAMQRVQINRLCHDEKLTPDQMKTTYELGCIAHRLIDMRTQQHKQIKSDHVLKDAYHYTTQMDMSKAPLHPHMDFAKDHYHDMHQQMQQAHQHQQLLHQQMQLEQERHREHSRGIEIGF